MSARDYSSLCDISPHTDRPLNDQREILTQNIQLTANSCFHSSDSSGSCDSNDQKTFFTQTFFPKKNIFFQQKNIKKTTKITTKKKFHQNF